MYGRNPFESDKDDFSFEAQANKRANAINSTSNTKKNTPQNPFYDEKDYSSPSSENNVLQQKVQSSMNRQLETTTRCLASLYDSEAIGIATAEELVRQGEKLDNAERNVDKIIADTKTSQRHLNSIKSVFGGIKNWWSGEKKEPSPPAPAPTRDRTGTTLGKALNTQAPKEPHPMLASKGYDTKGFYDEDVIDFDNFDPDNFGSKNQTRSTSLGQIKPQQNQVTNQTQQQQQQQQTSSSRSKEWQEYEKGLETNLSLMSNGLSNLKVLAQGLGEEIEVQNDQLDRISGKVDRSDTKIRNQNLQMKRILGK